MIYFLSVCVYNSGFYRPEEIFAESTDVLGAVFILAQQGLGGVDDAHHVAVGGVNDGAVHTGLHSQRHERHVQHLTHRQTEGNVAEAGGKPWEFPFAEVPIPLHSGSADTFRRLLLLPRLDTF